ncbi:MAG: ASKHA domain-containing protein [Geobacteraceae bacterium]|nr:ASKHA domain-containing protein [Geobacteraceae bacterium]
MISRKKLAIAVDVGTTTIAASLIDRNTCERFAFLGRRNPQGTFGPDVVSRLQAACESENNLAALQSAINRTLEEMVEELLHTAGTSLENVDCIALAGNPTMEHFLLGLPVHSLAFPPFRPLFSEGKRLQSISLGWKLDLNVYLFPLPGGFVGGDLVAFLHGCRSDENHSAPHTLYLDLGTNGEVALLSEEKIFATSAAAGPAFEGGNLACGMPALPGAIEKVEIKGEHISLTSISGQTPSGICGSGVIDTVSELLREGLIDSSGRLLPPEEISSNLGNRIVEIGGSLSFILYRDAATTVFLSQDDIRQVQLAKAAIRAGMEILFQHAGMHVDDLKKVVLTGSFGAVLSAEGLKNVGIFPENMVKIASFIREGALAGVERALCTQEGFAAVDNLARQVRVVPLSGTPAFEKHFLEQMNFPKT